MPTPIQALMIGQVFGTTQTTAVTHWMLAQQVLSKYYGHSKQVEW
ncbi:MAG: hypothetical protein WC325_03750 [Candidatus Bathyarchaeia archaeon]